MNAGRATRRFLRTSPWPLCLCAALSVGALLSTADARADEPIDTVMLTNGGRVRGIVMEEDPQKGTSIKLLDGTVKRLKPGEVKQILYGGAEAAPAQPGPVLAPTNVPTAAPQLPAAQSATGAIPAVQSPGVLPARDDAASSAAPVATHRRSGALLATGVVLSVASLVTLAVGVGFWVAFSNQETNARNGCGESSNWCGGGNPQTYQTEAIAMFFLASALGGAGIPMAVVGDQQVPNTATASHAAPPWAPTVSVGKNTVGLRFAF